MPKKLILRGKVQGVFCRRYCIDNAKIYRLKGAVSNLPNGNVELLLETNDNYIVAKLIKTLKNNTYNFTFHGSISSIKVDDYNASSKGNYLRGDYIF